MDDIRSNDRPKKMNSDHKISFRQAKLLARTFNIFCLIAALCLSSFENDHVKLYITVVLPFIGIFLMMLCNGRVALLSGKKNSGISTIFLGLLIIIAVSYFTLARKYYLLNHENFWLPFFVIGATMAAFLTSVGINRSAAIILQYVLIVALSGGYAVGTLVQVNCIFDNSAAIKFNTAVQDKSVIKHQKREPEYHLVLMPWERGQAPIEIEVSRTEYEQTPVDGPVGGHIKRGLLGIKWFYLDM